MSLSRQFACHDLALTRRIIAENPFASIICHDPEQGWLASDVPVNLLDCGFGQTGEQNADSSWQLEFHLAKSNPQGERLASAATVLMIVHGPNGYVSPNWYAHPEAVPTWNFLTVHIQGKTHEIGAGADDTALGARDALLKRLIERHEPAYIARWQALDAGYKQRMLRGIRAFRVGVTHIDTKVKLSQNRPAADQASVRAAHASGSPAQRELARWMVELGLGV